MRIASACERKIATSLRAASLVIHFEVASFAAVFPSSVEAIFQVKRGLAFTIFVSQSRFASAASDYIKPFTTSIPAPRRAASPPFAIGFGSLTAKTTLDIPA